MDSSEITVNVAINNISQSYLGSKNVHQVHSRFVAYNKSKE